MTFLTITDIKYSCYKFDFRKLYLGINKKLLMITNFKVFFPFLFTFIFIIIFLNWNDLFDDIYGHGLSRDESLPFDISGKQIAIEGILEPPFLNEVINQKPTFLVRSHDEKSNETIKDINYRIIVKFKNETILDQRFHTTDGMVSANLIPSNDTVGHEIINKDKEQQQQSISKQDLVEVSSNNPVTIKSKLLTDGGLYDLSVTLEKTSKGLKLDSDKKVNLYISIGKDFPFVIKDVIKGSTNNTTNKKNNNSNMDSNSNLLTFTVKTYYDEILDFQYDQDTSKISFKMPFRWDLNYVNQIVNLHEEIIIPKSFTQLSTVSPFTGTLNGIEIPRNAILIDDYSDQGNRIVHVVIVNFKLKEFTKQIIKEGGNPYAIFQLKPF